jgi:cob(I)alamin adenosyltransferase
MIGIKTAKRQSREQGAIHLYSGPGKGKSRAILGLLLRSLGAGHRVCLVQFLKGGRNYDEDPAIAALQSAFPHALDFIRCGRGEHLSLYTTTPDDYRESRRGWDIARGAVASGFYDLVALDEINPVAHLNLVSASEIVEALQGRKTNTEIILTGEPCPDDFSAIADLHSVFTPSREGELGNLHVITGDGKGKSTSALGYALEAIGVAMRERDDRGVAIIQFLKGGSGYTEDGPLRKLQESHPNMTYRVRCGRDAIVWRGRQTPLDYEEAAMGWDEAVAAIASGDYRAVILDEINTATDLHLLLSEPIYRAIAANPQTKIICTGRYSTPQRYSTLAGTTTTINCKRHYAASGWKLRQGIDY